MREKDKIEKYLERWVKAREFRINESPRSRYYWFKNRCIRISDHVAKASDGLLDIILDSADKDHYIVYARKTREMSVVNYKELKSIINTIALIPSLLVMLDEPIKTNKPNTEIKCDTKDTILGIPSQFFKEGQLQVIKATCKKVQKEHGVIRMQKQKR